MTMRLRAAGWGILAASLVGATLLFPSLRAKWEIASPNGRLGLPDPSTLNLLVITLDTTRADRLGAYGYSVQTPNIDRLAEEGVLFEQASSPAPLTLPAHGSLFTGRFPPSHGVRGNGGVFTDENHATLAEVLHDSGFETGAFVGAYVLDSTWGLDQGFATYDDGFEPSDIKSRGIGSLRRPADRVVDAALRWLGTVGASRFFAWVHFYDPHAPYDPPEPYRTMHADSPYVGEIGFMDAQIGRLLRSLDDQRLLDRTIVVVIGDHGESLGDHGERTHGFFVYESAIRIPFIIRAPSDSLRGRRVVDPVRAVDVMPTVLQLLGIPGPGAVEGTSLVPLMTGAVKRLGLGGYSEALLPRHGFGWSDLRSYRSGRYKLIAAPRPELYDLAVDPQETTNLYDARSRVGERLMNELDALEQRFVKASSATNPAAIIDPAQAARLASLGYVAGAVTRRQLPSDRKGLADPKDKIDEYNASMRRRDPMAPIGSSEGRREQ
jgi:arylsulfatase A-like enzyme